MCSRGAGPACGQRGPTAAAVLPSSPTSAGPGPARGCPRGPRGGAPGQAEGRANTALTLLGAVPCGDPAPACAPAPRGLPGAAAMGPESGAGGSCSLVGLGTGRLPAAPAPPPRQGRRQQLFHRLNLTRPWPRARPAGAGAEVVFVGRRDAEGSAVGRGGEAPDELLGLGPLCPACAKPCPRQALPRLRAGRARPAQASRGSPRHSRHPCPRPQLPCRRALASGPGARRSAVSRPQSVIFKLLDATYNKSLQNRICPKGRFNC